LLSTPFDQPTVIRDATVNDAAQLIVLMRMLAEYEGYAVRFVITNDELINRGLAMNAPAQFKAWVAAIDRTLLGYAIVYTIPFTFDLRPTIVLKELFVVDSEHRNGYGRQLFSAVNQYAQSINARLLRWQVLPNNDSAKRFYRSLGRSKDSQWESWSLDLDSTNSRCFTPCSR